MKPALFDFHGSLLRILDKDGAPWFVAADVCLILDLGNPSMAVNGSAGRAGLEEDEKGITSVDTLGGKQNVLCVSESGLYVLIFKSRKPQAVQFRKWVTSEVLPTIRRTGRFGAVPAPEPPAFPVPATMSEALRLAADTMDQLDAAKAELADAAPKLLTYNRTMSSDALLGLREAAGIIAERGIGSTNMVRILKEAGVLYVQQGGSRGHLRAKAKYIHDGYFKLVERIYDVPAKGGGFTGETKVEAVVRVTPKGIEFIIRLLERRGVCAERP